MPDLMEGAPKQGIIVDRQNFCNIKPIFTASNSNIKMLDFSWYLNKGYTILYNGKSPASTSCGEFSLRWNNIGIDEDGDSVDIVMRVSNIIGYGYTNPCFLTIGSAGGIEALGKTWASPYTSSTRSVGKNSFDIEYFIYKHQEDNNSNIPANGNWVIQYTDIDQPVEDIRLKANYEQDIHVIPDDMKLENRGHDVGGCWLTFSNLSTEPYIKIPKEYWDDNSTLHSGFCLSAKNGYKFGWEGYDCGTAINEMYGQSKITATHDDGGVITDLGTTEVAWKHDKTYTVTADKHHVISRIIVDGKDIPVTNPKEQSYTFQEVISDHTIHVSFTNIQHALIYDANTSSDDGYTGETPSTIHDAGANAPISDNGFVRAGYRFIGWNTEPDGSGESYSPEDEIFIDDRDITLYAQWERLVSVTFMDEDGTVYTVDDNVPIGGGSTPPIVPARRGYTFAGWTGTYTDVQKDEIVIASWSPNRYDIIYEPNGGEGEHMPVQQTRYDEDETISESSYTRHNYEFVGWNTSPDGTGTSYTPGDVVKNLTDEPDGKVYLYAQWEFYIQMPETGEIGGEALAITGLGMVSVAFASVMISRRQRRRAVGAEASQRRPDSAPL